MLQFLDTHDSLHLPAGASKLLLRKAEISRLSSSNCLSRDDLRPCEPGVDSESTNACHKVMALHRSWERLETALLLDF
jgi:hypothetical protein